jgi:hypothetical protein
VDVTVETDVKEGVPFTLGEAILAGASDDEPEPPPQPTNSALIIEPAKIERFFHLQHK